MRTDNLLRFARLICALALPAAGCSSDDSGDSSAPAGDGGDADPGKSDTANEGGQEGHDGAEGQDGDGGDAEGQDGAGGDAEGQDGGEPDGGVQEGEPYFFTQCRFGDRWIDLHRIAVSGETPVSAEAPPSDDQARLILAGLKHEWGDEESPADMDEAYDATDDKEFLISELTEVGDAQEEEGNTPSDDGASGREEGEGGGEWVAIRYYAGDTEAGFIFEPDGEEPVISIGDGEIWGCISGFESNSKHDELEDVDGAPDRSHWITWASLNDSLVDLHAVEITDPRTLTSAADATDIEGQQLMAGVPASDSVEQAFDNSDDGEFLLHTLTDPESGDEFTLFRYWAGDNPVGFACPAGEADVRLEIGDGEIADVSVRFEPNPE